MLDIKAIDFISDKEIFAEMVMNHYENIVENSTGVDIIELGTPLDPNLDRDTVKKILKHYEIYATVIEI